MIIKSDNKTNNFMIKIKNYISTQRRPGLLLLGLLLAVINHFYIVEHNGLFGLWVYILAANIMGASLYRYLDSYHPFKISIITFTILIGVSFVNIYTDSKTTTPIPLNNENIQMIDVSEKMIITVDKPFKKVLIFQLGSLEYFEFKESMKHNDNILEIIETKTYDHLDKTFNKSKPSDIIYDINVKFGSKLFTKRNYCLNIMEDYEVCKKSFHTLNN